jgi:hypothetical protein
MGMTVLCAAGWAGGETDQGINLMSETENNTLSPRQGCEALGIKHSLDIFWPHLAISSFVKGPWLLHSQIWWLLENKFLTKVKWLGG